jgi:hypothetical protein
MNAGVRAFPRMTRYSRSHTCHRKLIRLISPSTVLKPLRKFSNSAIRTATPAFAKPITYSNKGTSMRTNSGGIGSHRHVDC